MDEAGSEELPIFELGLAIVPGEQVPLHIFEPRYRAMIGHCLSESVPFGIVLTDDDGARSLGCTALVSDVVERYDDGRLDIVVTGARPFRVLERFDAEQWPAGRVELVADEEPGGAGSDELGDARAAFAELLEAVGAQPERADAAPGAFAIAAQIEMPPEEKQALLESEDELERLTLLTGSLRKLLAGVKRSRELAERAKGNGHAPGRLGPASPP
jgi:Lon protease-like protein